MKRNAIFMCDILACIIVFAWSMIGPWDRILGFNLYHSRGDVWLPTPIPAANFFRGMVSTGSMLFGCFFLLTSCLFFFLGRARGTAADGKRGILCDAFYGDTSKLIVKYAAFLFISVISPFFYNYMWRFHLTRTGRIGGGFAISIASFVLVVAIGGLAARIKPVRQVPSL